MTPKNTMSDGEPAAQAARDQPLDDRVQPDREEQRHDDEDDDAAGLDHGLHEEARDEDPEGAEEAEHERRVAADRAPEPAELRVLAVGSGPPARLSRAAAARRGLGRRSLAGASASSLPRSASSRRPARRRRLASSVARTAAPPPAPRACHPQRLAGEGFSGETVGSAAPACGPAPVAPSGVLHVRRRHRRASPPARPWPPSARRPARPPWPSPPVGRGLGASTRPASAGRRLVAERVRQRRTGEGGQHLPHVGELGVDAVAALGGRRELALGLGADALGGRLGLGDDLVGLAGGLVEGALRLAVGVGAQLLGLEPQLLGAVADAASCCSFAFIFSVKSRSDCSRRWASVVSKSAAAWAALARLFSNSASASSRRALASRSDSSRRVSALPLGLLQDPLRLGVGVGAALLGVPLGLLADLRRRPARPARGAGRPARRRPPCTCCGLLVGQAEDLLDPRAQPGVRRCLVVGGRGVQLLHPALGSLGARCAVSASSRFSAATWRSTWDGS